MSRMRVVLDVDAPSGQAVGVKEALAMDLEKYGDVRVVSVEIREPEQQCLPGMGPPPGSRACLPDRRTSLPGAAFSPSWARECPTHRVPEGPMRCCKNCGGFQYAPGRDEQGRVRWGSCRLTGQTVDKLSAQCGEWKPKR